MLKHLPNTLTLLNLACGFLAVLSLFQGQTFLAAMLVVAAAVLDFLDGMVARLLGAYSAMGKDLDSLADCVSFGLVPGFFLMKALTQACEITCGGHFPESIPPKAYLALGVPMMSALRLAIFNNDTRQSDRFIGVPTPANALFVVFLVVATEEAAWPSLQWLLSDQAFWSAITLLCSGWLVVEVPLLALKFKSYGLTTGDNPWRYGLIGFGAVCLGLFGYYAVPLVILGYVLLSLIYWRGRPI